MLKAVGSWLVAFTFSPPELDGQTTTRPGSDVVEHLFTDGWQVDGEELEVPDDGGKNDLRLLTEEWTTLGVLLDPTSGPLVGILLAPTKGTCRVVHLDLQIFSQSQGRPISDQGSGRSQL